LEPIPDNWPPAPLKEMPLFALENVWLFPYVILPLRIFEPRYRQMIEDILDGTGRIILGTVQEGQDAEPGENPPIYPIAGLGEIGRHERLDDGRFNILLLGLRRVRVKEVESDRLYRKVRVEPAEEIPIAPDIEPEIKKQLHEAILERTDQTTFLPQVSVSHLADLLTLRMPLPHDVLNELYCELDEEKRARRALAEHAIRPKIEDEAESEGEGEGSPESGD